MLREKLCICITLSLLSLPVFASTIMEVMSVADKSNTTAENSQKNIDAMVQQSLDMASEYKQESRNVENLTIYNKKLARQINEQREYLQQLEVSRKNALVMQRQILPQLESMINVLDDFIHLDAPFYLEERKERISFLRANIERPDLSLAEKFRQVMEAYQIEKEYGRKIDNYIENIEIDGVNKQVTVLRVGRLALFYQTADFLYSGIWDKQQKSWQTLSTSTEQDAVKKAIKQASIQQMATVFEIPVPVAEVMP